MKYYSLMDKVYSRKSRAILLSRTSEQRCSRNRRADRGRLW